MKRHLLSLLACLLLISMLFTSCRKPDSDPAETDPAESESESESETIPEGPYTARHTYIPASVSAEVKTIFEGKGDSYTPLTASEAPYALHNIYAIGNLTLKSITIPVYETKSTDGNGDFTMTVYTTGNSYEGLRKVTGNDKAYTVKINASQHGLTANQTGVCRYITVDVSSYNIKLTENESLAFFNPAGTDTLIPAKIVDDGSRHNLLDLFYEKFSDNLGCFRMVGTTSLSTSLDTLFFDFGWEITYDSYEEFLSVLSEDALYEEMVRVIGEKYKGGYLSILGDSISTFKNVSNNSSHNSTIKNTREWYYPHAGYDIYDQSETYWGRFLEDTGLSLAVNNSWSGSRVYGRVGYSDNMLLRSTQLHRDKTGGAEPSLIFVYMGVNDMRNDREIEFGDLYEILRKKDGKSDKDKVDAWFKEVLAHTDLTGEIKRGVTYETFEQAYALSLYSMKARYTNADIYCLTAMQHYDSAYGTYPNYNDEAAAETTEEFNRVIRALAEYFEVGLVDQDTGDFRFETAHAYCNDKEALHPNLLGHKKMTELIVKTIYKDITKG